MKRRMLWIGIKCQCNLILKQIIDSTIESPVGDKSEIRVDRRVFHSPRWYFYLTILFRMVVGLE